MMKEYQVTLFAKNKKYKSVACIVRDSKGYNLDDPTDRKHLIKRGVEKICILRGWTTRDLEELTFLTAKVRENKK